MLNGRGTGPNMGQVFNMGPPSIYELSSAICQWMHTFILAMFSVLMLPVSAVIAVVVYSTCRMLCFFVEDNFPM